MPRELTNEERERCRAAFYANLGVSDPKDLQAEFELALNNLQNRLGLDKVLAAHRELPQALDAFRAAFFAPAISQASPAMEEPQSRREILALLTDALEVNRRLSAAIERLTRDLDGRGGDHAA